MNNRPLITPQINLNGTSRKELLDQQIDVMTKARALLVSMATAMPHGRDYQTAPGQLLPARAAWSDRMDGIRQLLLEVEKHAESLLPPR